MAWRNEPQRENRARKSNAESVAQSICLGLTILFAFIAICAAGLSVFAMYSLPGIDECTLEELAWFAWQEFQYGAMWPLIAAGLSFLTWNVLRARSKNRGDVT